MTEVAKASEEMLSPHYNGQRAVGQLEKWGKIIENRKIIKEYNGTKIKKIRVEVITEIAKLTIALPKKI